MHILFIYPNLMRQEDISLGIASLSAYLKKHGHRTSLIDYTWGGTIESALRAIRKDRPDLIAFSLRTGEFPFSLALARRIKAVFGPDIPLVFGGVHPTIAPERVIAHPEVDFVCVGEGEEALRTLGERLMKNDDTAGIPNIWTKRDGAVISNPPAPLIDPLDLLPFPDRELFDMERYIRSRNGGTNIMSSRGCPFDCHYCINHELHRLYTGKGPLIRKRSVDNVIAEISSLISRYGVSRLFFHDDVFVQPLSWIEEFSKKLPRAPHLTYSCSARPEQITPALCRHLKESGCSNLCIGVESGSETIRRSILNRQITDERIREAFAISRAAGLDTYSFNMIGLPTETVADIRKTIGLNRTIDPDFLQVAIFQPFPGTRLHTLCVENHWCDKDVLPYSHQFSSLLSYPHLSRRRIYWEKVLFRYRVLRKRNLLKALITLFYDLLFVHITKVRQFVPHGVKRAANALLVEQLLKKKD